MSRDNRDNHILYDTPLDDLSPRDNRTAASSGAESLSFQEHEYDTRVAGKLGRKVSAN